ncbi:hypothetical protein [uncultured Spirosoma sp.]|uniref:hypothetical protein n=1 Tax=uncultured Spirosoma sp. TaxID=278208 RepID=UPI00258F6C13|nr:hypothetical protein [uncultured Spirosoma sp.]
MSQSIRWFILSMPLLAFGLLWPHLPTRIVIHSANADKWVSREDFGGIVVGTTMSVALLAYGLLQVQSAFQPFSQRELNKAYSTIAIGAALIGFVVLGAGLGGH